MTEIPGGEEIPTFSKNNDNTASGNNYLNVSPKGYYIRIGADAIKEVRETSSRVVADLIRLCCSTDINNVIKVSGKSVSAMDTDIKDMISDTHGLRFQQLMNTGLIDYVEGDYIISNRFLLKRNDTRKHVKIYKQIYSRIYQSFTAKDRDTLGKVYKLVGLLDNYYNALKEYGDSGYKPTTVASMAYHTGASASNGSRISKELTELTFVESSIKFRAVIRGKISNNSLITYYINPLLANKGCDITRVLNIVIKSSRGNYEGFKY